MMSVFFHLQHTLNRLFNNCLKLHWYQISSSWNTQIEKTTLKKSPALLGLRMLGYIIAIFIDDLIHDDSTFEKCLKKTKASVHS